MTSQQTAPAAADPAAVEAWQRIRSICGDPETVAAEHRFMRENGLTGGPMKALRFLPASGSLSMRQLAGLMGCDNSYVTPVVDTLEKQGLARREPHPTDRRIKAVVLTAEGRRLAERVRREYAAPPSAFAALSPADAATLCELLRKLDPSAT